MQIPFGPLHVVVAATVLVSACSPKQTEGGDDDPTTGGAPASGGVGGSVGGAINAGAGGITSAGASGMTMTVGGGAGVGGTSGGSAGTGAGSGGATSGSAGVGGASVGGSAGTSAVGGASGMSTGGVGAMAGAGGSAGGLAGGAGTSAAGSTSLPPGNGCTPGQLMETGELQGRFDTLQPTIGGQEYFLQVNEWNSMSAQTMAYGGDFFFKMTTQMGSASTSGGPTGFPSMFIGANSRHTTANSNMPKQVSALTTVPTTWIWNDNGTLTDGSIYNATYDVWFSTNPAGEPTQSGPSGGYLMVWLHDPDMAQPIGGSPMFQGVTIDGVSGTWDVWIGPNGTRPCISYVRTETALALSFDLNSFIKDAVTNRTGTIQSGWYLTNIFTGFEIWSGGQNLESTAFCAVVN